MTHSPPPVPECVAQMEAFDELCRLNPRLRALLIEADLNTAAQLNIFYDALYPFGGDMAPMVNQLEEALRNHLKMYPPLTPRARRGKV